MICRPSLRSRQRGTVTIEMLMSFLPLLFTFLGVTQLAYVRFAQIVVQHAANRGARSAMVVLDDDPQYYDDAPRGSLTDGETDSGDGDILAAAKSAIRLTLSSREEGEQGGARYATIRAAAYHPLMVLAPSPRSLLPAFLGTDFDLGILESPWSRIAFGALLYNRSASAVTVHVGREEMPATTIAGNVPVRVRVSYLLRCNMPFVSSLMCYSGASLRTSVSGPKDASLAGDIKERLEYVQSSFLRDRLLELGGRFVLIEGEATLPNQSATYEYPEKSDE